MTLSEIVVDMRKLTGIHDLALDPDTRACRLVFGGVYEVEFEEAPARGAEMFFMHSVVGPLPPSAPSAVFARLLRAGLFGRETGGAQIGYDDTRQEVILFQRMDTRHLDMPAFTRELDYFLAVLKDQQRQLTHGTQDEGHPEPRAPYEPNSLIRG